MRFLAHEKILVSYETRIFLFIAVERHVFRLAFYIQKSNILSKLKNSAVR